MGPKQPDYQPQVCHNNHCKMNSDAETDGTNCRFPYLGLPQMCPAFMKVPPEEQPPPSRAEKLVNAHWNGYVGPLLKSCGVAADLLPTLEFMYKSSGIHFYKHAMEDQHELARKAILQRDVLRGIGKKEPDGAATCLNYSHEDGTCAVLGKVFDCYNCQSFQRKA